MEKRINKRKLKKVHSSLCATMGQYADIQEKLQRGEKFSDLSDADKRRCIEYFVYFAPDLFRSMEIFGEKVPHSARVFSKFNKKQKDELCRLLCQRMGLGVID